MRVRFAVLGMVIAVMALVGLTARVDGESGFYNTSCRGCHGTTSTCKGCHAHGVHSSSAHSDLNVSGTTDQASYLPGETVTVTVRGGYRSGWVRAFLHDDNMVELARSSGPAGMGGGPSLPVDLSAPAPLTPGTYTWNVSWYGHRYDESGAYFGPRWRPDPSNPDHGEEIVSTNQFSVAVPPVPVIALDPQSVAFGTVTVGASATEVVTVANHGTANLDVTGISRCAGTSSEFTWFPDAPFTVAPGGSQYLSVTYEPLDGGSDAGCLSLASNDPAAATVSLAVSGTGSVPPPPDPDVNLDPTSLDFGTVVVGGPPAEQSTEVHNLGLGTLEVFELALCTGTSGEFAWDLATPFTVGPGQSRTLSVTYEPADEGSDDGCVEVISNDPVTPVVNLALAGSGLIPPPVAADIELDPSALSFGLVGVGSPSATLEVEVGNLGNDALLVTAISLCQGTSPEFTWAPLAPLTIGVGESATLSVSYTPDDDGSDLGCLAFASNDPVDPVVDLSLAGSGTSQTPLFGDGFDSGDLGAWSAAMP